MRFYSRWAHRLYPRRLYFAAIALGTFAALALLMAANTPHLTSIMAFAATPIIVIAWGLLCMCVWFDPERGDLQRGRLIGFLPKPLKVVVQWYFVGFLTLWFVVGTVGFPLFV